MENLIENDSEDEIASEQNDETDKKYIYFIREGEFRTKISGKSKEKIISLLFKMFKIVFDYCEFDFSSEEDIIDFNNYDY